MVHPDHEKLMVPNTQNVSQIVTVMSNRDPTAIVFPDAIGNNRDQMTFHKMQTSPSPFTFYPTVEPISYTYANCGSITNADNSKASASADSEIRIFPNGTKVSISKCQVELILNRNKKT